MSVRVLPLVALILLAAAVAADGATRRQDVTVSGVRLVPTRVGHVVVQAQVRNEGGSAVQGAVRFQVTPDGGPTHVMVQSFGALAPGRRTRVQSGEFPTAANQGRGELYRLRVDVIADLPAVAVATPRPDLPRRSR